MKILVLTEMMSRCIGYVVVGEDVEAARRQIVVWLQHFGLTSKAVSIDVHTDSERAVGEIIGNSTGRYTFSIRRAAPQQHRSIGSAERTVRELKESFSVLRADLNAQGLDVTFSHENLVDVLTYLALCNNHFSTSRGSDRSPLEMVSGRKLSKPVSTLFGAQVLAEIPDSIRQHSPLSTRNVECTFIHMGLERGPVVQGFIRVDGKAELMRFVARNIRAISPLRWDLNSGQGVLTQFDTGTVGSRPQIVNDSGTAPADMSQLPPEELRKLKGQSLPAPSQPKLVLPESSSVKKKSGELRLAPAVPLARLQGGPGSFLAISIRFFTEGIDFERIGFRFRLARFDYDSIRNDSRSAGSMGVSKRFLININSIACDSIFDLDSSFKFDSIACVSICGSIR